MCIHISSLTVWHQHFETCNFWIWNQWCRRVLESDWGVRPSLTRPHQWLLTDLVAASHADAAADSSQPLYPVWSPVTSGRTRPSHRHSRSVSVNNHVNHWYDQLRTCCWWHSGVSTCHLIYIHMSWPEFMTPLDVSDLWATPAVSEVTKQELLATLWSFPDPDWNMSSVKVWNRAASIKSVRNQSWSWIIRNDPSWLSESDWLIQCPNRDEDFVLQLYESGVIL